MIKCSLCNPRNFYTQDRYWGKNRCRAVLAFNGPRYISSFTNQDGPFFHLWEFFVSLFPFILEKKTKGGIFLERDEKTWDLDET